MENYIYTGQLQAVDIDGKGIIFADGKEYTLPPANYRVKRLVKLGYLAKVNKNKKGAK